MNFPNTFQTTKWTNAHIFTRFNLILYVDSQVGSIATAISPCWYSNGWAKTETRRETRRGRYRGGGCQTQDQTLPKLLRRREGREQQRIYTEVASVRCLATLPVNDNIQAVKVVVRFVLLHLVREGFEGDYLRWRLQRVLSLSTSGGAQCTMYFVANQQPGGNILKITLRLWRLLSSLLWYRELLS